MNDLADVAGSIKFWKMIEERARMAIFNIRFDARAGNDVGASHSNALADLEARIKSPFDADIVDEWPTLQCNLFVRNNGIVLTDVPETVELYEFSGLCRCCDVTIKAKEDRLFDVQIVLLKDNISVEQLKNWVMNGFSHIGINCSIINDSVKSISPTCFSLN